jgi:hypothetical protein
MGLSGQEVVMSEQLCCKQGANLDDHKPKLVPIRYQSFVYAFTTAIWWNASGFLLRWLDLPQDHMLNQLVVLILGLFVLGLGLITFFSFLWHAADSLATTFVGRTVYWYRDTLKQIHVHTKMPQFWVRQGGVLTELNKGSSYHVCEPGFEVVPGTAVGPILKVRQGGFFRKSQIIGNNLWKIISCWDGKNIVLQDPAMVTIGGPGLTKDRLFDLVEDNIDLSTRQDNYKSLGRDVVIALQQIRAMRTTLGKSKHAKALRRFLESSLDTVPNSICRRWEKRIKNDEFLAGRRWQLMAGDTGEPDNARARSTRSARRP